MGTVDISVRLSTVVCASSSCGLTFAVPEDWEASRRRDHSWFYCPNGHTQHWPVESDVEKARRERDEATRLAALRLSRIDQLAKEVAGKEKSLVAQRGATTRIRNRAAAGLCPYCKRSFACTRMAAHVRTKHPEHKKAQASQETKP